MEYRPDLVLIMTDQQRFDQAGYQSGGHFDTPNIDGLAEQGVIFDNAYSASTTCVPARVSLLTGLHNHRVPTQLNRYALREGFWTVAHALRQVGYETVLIGKMHFAPIRAQHGFERMRLCEHLFRRDLSPRDGGPPEGVDDYHEWLLARGLADWRAVTSPGPQRTPFPYGAEFHPTAWVESEAVSFLKRRKQTRPLFLVVSFPHPHAPYNAPEPYASRCQSEDEELPADGFEVNKRLPAGFLRAMTSRFGRFEPRLVQQNEHEAREALGQIRALISQIDDAVGHILNHIDLTSSVVFFTSDHGDYSGHRGMMGKVPWIPFDDLAKVPLVVSGCEVVGGRRVPELVQNSDFALTCLDYAGEKVTEGVFDTRSLRSLLCDRPRPEDLDRTVLCATTMGWPMIRRGPLKYIRHLRSDPSDADVLFDLDQDPGETVSVLDAAAYQSAADEVASLLGQELARDVPALPNF
jgi:arylsulfatase A-like enzyme